MHLRVVKLPAKFRWIIHNSFQEFSIFFIATISLDVKTCKSISQMAPFPHKQLCYFDFFSRSPSCSLFCCAKLLQSIKTLLSLALPSDGYALLLVAMQNDFRFDEHAHTCCVDLTHHCKHHGGATEEKGFSCWKEEISERKRKKFRSLSANWHENEYQRGSKDNLSSRVQAKVCTKRSQQLWTH